MLTKPSTEEHPHPRTQLKWWNMSLSPALERAPELSPSASSNGVCPVWILKRPSCTEILRPATSRFYECCTELDEFSGSLEEVMGRCVIAWTSASICSTVLHARVLPPAGCGSVNQCRSGLASYAKPLSSTLSRSPSARDAYVFLRRDQPDEVPQAGTPSGEHGGASGAHASVPLASSAQEPSECFASGSAPHGCPQLLAGAAAAAGLPMGDGASSPHMSGARFVPCSGTTVHESGSPSDDSGRMNGAQTGVVTPQARPQRSMSRVQSLPAMPPNAAAQSVGGLPPLPAAPQQLRLGLHALLGQQPAFGLGRSAGDRMEEHSNAPSSSGKWCSV